MILYEFLDWDEKQNFLNYAGIVSTQENFTYRTEFQFIP